MPRAPANWKLFLPLAAFGVIILLIILFLDHRSLIKNKKHTAVMKILNLHIKPKKKVSQILNYHFTCEGCEKLH